MSEVKVGDRFYFHDYDSGKVGCNEVIATPSTVASLIKSTASHHVGNGGMALYNNRYLADMARSPVECLTKHVKSLEDSVKTHETCLERSREMLEKAKADLAIARAAEPLFVEAVMAREPVLCYVEGAFAYFTTRGLDKQWGDDWNDAPYEHNAGAPYEYGDHYRELGDEPWKIIRIAFRSPSLMTPAERQSEANSAYTVQGINQGKTPWLATSRMAMNKIQVFAGATMAEFCHKVRESGGEIFVEDEWFKYGE